MDLPVVTIGTEHSVYTPVTAEGITWETCRAGAPGTLSFSVIKDSVISFHEGDRVTLSLGGAVRFAGFVFSKRRRADGIIQVTAYDQLRYLKNRDSYTYEGLTATQVAGRVAADAGLNAGVMADTGYVIPSRVENGRTLLDIVQTALDLTARQTGEVYVLYDEAGALRLSHVGDLALDTPIHAGSIGDFDYTSSIDRDTYTAVKLYRDEGDSGETVFYTAERSDLVRRWGRLQVYARLEEDEDGPTTAGSLLDLYGRRTRQLRITDAVGDIRVRGGCLMPVELDLGDIVLGEFLLVERVVHRFSENGHMMDLTLTGGEFVE